MSKLTTEEARTEIEKTRLWMTRFAVWSVVYFLLVVVSESMIIRGDRP